MLSRLRIIIFTKHLRYIKNLITRQIWMSEDLPGSPISDQYLANSILNICSFCFLGFEYKHTVSLVWNTSTKFLFQIFLSRVRQVRHFCCKNLTYTFMWRPVLGSQGAFRVQSSIFIIAGLEPKLFVFKSLTQQQGWGANKNGQFCHQDQPSISPYSKYRDRALVAAKLAPKW